ncbi:MAG TPA: AMP-binding protein [Xanthobacteraceae bacterium]|jgi:acetyl-CoA synthetase
MLSSIEATSNAATLIVDRHISDNAGDKPALRYGEKRYSYHDLAALMNRAGNMLRRFGVGVGDEILIAVPPSPSLVASLLGAMKIGAAAILLPRSAARSAVDSLVSQRPVKLAIAEAARVSLFPQRESWPVLVVGEAQGPCRSFVTEMRESASSLARSQIEQSAPAVAVADGDQLRWLKHADIAAAKPHSSVALMLDDWDLGEALSRFAHTDEVRL